jgi:pseudouridine synthase
MAERPLRLNKALKELGLASRREGDRLIRQGEVTVNGIIVKEPWHHVDLDKDIIALTSTGNDHLNDKKYIAYYKPKGIVSTFGQKEGKFLGDVFSAFQTLSYAGRLDKESEGLMILSDDGLFIASVRAPEKLKEKEYEVTVAETVHEGALEKMRQGMMLGGKALRKAYVSKRSPHSFAIILTEGKNRQVRRMASKVGLTVTALKRVRIGPVTVEGLQPDQWRELTQEEIRLLSK